MLKKISKIMFIAGYIALFFVFMLDDESFNGDFSKQMWFICVIVIFWAVSNLIFAYSLGKSDDEEITEEPFIEDFDFEQSDFYLLAKRYGYKEDETVNAENEQK